MSKYIIDGETLTDIAVAIREKTGTNLKIKAKDFANTILHIDSQSSVMDALWEFLGAQMSGETVALQVFPIVHNINVKLTSDTITDFSGVKLVKSGLNIWDEQWELGSIGGTGANQTATNTIRSKNYIPVKGGVKYEIFAPQMSKVVCYDTNKKYYTLSYPSGNGSFTPSQDGYVRFAIGGSVGASPGITKYEDNICISVYGRSTVSVYEPYIEPIEYKAEADGTVEGVTSIYPTTILTTDSGAVINCNYIKNLEASVVSLIEGDVIEFEIPQGISNIGHGAFYADQQLERISIPNTVMRIGERAFYQCYALNNVVLPDSLKSLGFGVFYACTSLESIEIPKSVTTMSYEVFRNCSALKTVTFEEGSLLTQIPNYTFTDCKALEKIKIPSEVIRVGTQAFDGCSNCLEYDFSELSSPPELYSRVFDRINGGAKIIVPAGSYYEWITATNWADLSEYIVGLLKLQADASTGEILITADDVGPTWDFGYYATDDMLAYVKYSDGDTRKVMPDEYIFGNIQFTVYHDAAGHYTWYFTDYGGATYLGSGTYEICVEFGGKKVYRRIIEVAK